MGHKKLKITFLVSTLALMLVGSYAYWHLNYQKPYKAFTQSISAYNYGINICPPNQKTQALLSRGFDIALKKAGKGSVENKYEVGIAYLSGTGVPQDTNKGTSLIQTLAEQGLSDAEVSYGSILGTKLQQLIQAQQWYQKAADQGNPFGQVSLASSYITNGTILQNQSNYQSLLIQASKSLGIAKYMLAEAYENGYGATQSDTEALKWYEAAFNDSTLPQAYKQDSATSISMIYSKQNSQSQATSWGNIAQELYNQKGCQKIE